MIDPDCSKANEYVNYIVQHGYDKCESTLTRYCCQKLGWNDFGGRHIYFGGDKVIGTPAYGTDPEQNTAIVFDAIPQSFAVDTENYSEEAAAAGLWKTVELNPNVGCIILAFTITSIIKPIFKKALVPHKSFLYVQGLTGTLKSVFISLISKLYDRNKDLKPPTRFNSTKYSMEQLLDTHANSVVIIDDLYPSKNLRNKAEHEDIFEEICRIVGDDIGKTRMIGGKPVEYRPLASIITTGEYDLYLNASSTARYLTVTFDADLGETSLFQLQKEPLLISTFYYYLIQWVADNYESITNNISELAEKFRTNLPKCDMHRKLIDTYFVLCTSYNLFILYCREKGLLPVDATNKEMEFEDILFLLLCKQNELVKDREQKETSENKGKAVDYVEIIRDLY
ncbi:MAG: hypothetical protein FWD71_22955 [Oscillospiraceae bacterium]|nr:hypothetical protein [Oscillospiraceae bacterium]